MPSSVFRPTGAAFDEPVSPNPSMPSVIAGAGLVDDNDLASYVELAVTSDPAGAGSFSRNAYKWALGTNPFADFPADTSTLTAVSVTFECVAALSYIDSPPYAGAQAALDLRYTDLSGNHYVWSSFTTDNVSGVGASITAADWLPMTGTSDGPPFIDDPGTVDWDALRTLGTFEVVGTMTENFSTAFSVATIKLRIYEVRMTVDWETSGPTFAPPLRQYPRSDGLGGGTKRLYPTPPSIQRGIRRAGGYL